MCNIVIASNLRNNPVLAFLRLDRFVPRDDIRMMALTVIILFLSNLALAKDELNVRDALYKQQIEHMRKNMNSPEQIQKAAKEYEAVAVTKMLQQMYSDVKIDPLFDNKNTESIYKDLLLTEYGKIVAENGGIGLAKSLSKDIQKEKK